MLIALDDASDGFAAVTTRGDATLSSWADLARQPLVIGTVSTARPIEGDAVEAEQDLAAPGCRLVSSESAVTVLITTLMRIIGSPITEIIDDSFSVLEQSKKAFKCLESNEHPRLIGFAPLAEQRTMQISTSLNH